MEQSRRCGYLERASRGVEKVVWAAAGVASVECPTSYITAESTAWLDRYWVWKALGGIVAEESNAREVDAMITLEAEWREEQRNESR